VKTLMLPDSDTQIAAAIYAIRLAVTTRDAFPGLHGWIGKLIR